MLYVPDDARVYNVWKLSVSCNGWHLIENKTNIFYKNGTLKRGA
jgi:hypothetical protein